MIPPTYLCIEVTERCNHACVHCYNFWRNADGSVAAGGEKPLSRREIVTLVARQRESVPIDTLAITGGEPLLRPDLPELVSDLTYLGFEVVVITNGVLLKPAKQARFPRGTHFEVPLLGPSAEVHDRLSGRVAFDRLCDNLAELPSHGHSFTAVFVASRHNALLARKTIELGIALGAGTFMYNRVNLTGRLRPGAADLVAPRAMLQESLDQVQAAVDAYGVQVVCSVPIPPCVVDVRRYPGIQFGWCPRGGADSYYVIDIRGRVRPCNHSSAIIGDLKTESLAEILARPEVRGRWSALPPECAGCEHPLRDQCRGGCPAAAEEYYGSRLRADPVCELSLREEPLIQLRTASSGGVKARRAAAAGACR